MSIIDNLDDALSIFRRDPAERVIVTFVNNGCEHRLERALRELDPNVVLLLKKGGYTTAPAGGRLVPVDDSLLGDLVPNGAHLAQTWIWRPDGMTS